MKEYGDYEDIYEWNKRKNESPFNYEVILKGKLLPWKQKLFNKGEK